LKEKIKGKETLLKSLVEQEIRRTILKENLALSKQGHL
jgi:hypothetical protein